MKKFLVETIFTNNNKIAPPIIKFTFVAVSKNAKEARTKLSARSEFGDLCKQGYLIKEASKITPYEGNYYYSVEELPIISQNK